MNQIARRSATIIMFVLIGGIVMAGMRLGYPYFLPLANYGASTEIAALAGYFVALMLVVATLVRGAIKPARKF